ncbi:hypothetical protein [Methanohalophilus sp.]|uniref:hypothetical protein n=1 Tax=Methanohalophilus sp. TaxID=1966352 RepID=UPI002617CA41|nr:hypothetical protein [Methanohalophilus sp.]MDK2892222.1 hypothetical protein [Methanohalophilus sp.]
MKQTKIILFSCLLICLLTSAALANEDIAPENLKEIEILEAKLHAAVEKQNQVVTDGDSSFEDALVCINQVDDIIYELEELGMGVELKQTSDVHVNNKNEPMPANVSAKVVPISALKEISYTFTMDESKEQTLKEVYGTDITKGEFLEAIFPEALDVLPEETLSRFYKTPMTWPEDERITTSLQPKEQSRGQYYEMQYTSWIDALSTSEVKFRSRTRVVYPSTATKLPEIDVFSYLWLNGASSPMDSKYKLAVFASSVDVSKERTVNPGFYFTKGFHHALLPLIPPQYVSAVTVTPLEAVGVA